MKYVLAILLLLGAVILHGSVCVAESQASNDRRDIADYIELGKTYIADGMPEKAEQEFNAAIGIDPKCVQPYLLSALAVRKQKKPDLKKALSLLEKAAGIAPDDGAVHLSLAEVYTDMRSDDKASIEFAKAISLSQDDAVLVSAHLGLMAIYEKRDDSENAKKEYEEAKAIFPGVDEIIREAEIAHLAPAPVYAGGSYGEGGYHPFLEDRIKHAEDQIDKK